MTPALLPDDLHRAFIAFTEGGLDAEGLARLEERLVRDPAARRAWFLHCDLENGLADWATARGGRDAPIPAPPRRRVRATSAWLALAASLLVAASLGWLAWRGAETETPSTSVAVLARAVGAEWADGAVFRAGVALEPATLRLRTGSVLLEFLGGARVVVEGPAEVELRDGGSAFLHAGKIRAQVPRQARGFAIGLPGARVVDLGTEFAVSVPERDPAEVHVFSGSVSVTPEVGGAQALAGGEALRLDPAGHERIAARPADFLGEAELDRRVDAESLRREADARSASRALATDPATLLHFRPNEADGRALVNHARRHAAPGAGAIVGAGWTDGRLPGRAALAFRGEGDRVRVEVPDPFASLTLLAWVRVESLPRWHNALLASESDAPGSLRWHLTQRGELRLEIARDLGRAERDWEAVNSRPFLAPSEFGRWILLATTFDGATIRHFADGEPVGEGASFTPPALSLGAADLANWSGPTQRHLAADLDEFALLDRPLSPGEIRDFARRGRNP